MVYSGVLLGGIGTVVETSALQLESFNRAFEEHGIDFVWDEDDYAKSLSNAGGRSRLRALKMPDGKGLSGEQVAQVHDTKTRLFDEAMVERGLQLREGVAALVARTKDQGVKLGWASTTSRVNIDAILEAVGGALSADDFACICDVSMVEKPKPAPEIYELTLERMGVAPGRALAIEDAPTGVTAATTAGIETIAFPGHMTARQDFSAASRTVMSLDEIVPML